MPLVETFHSGARRKVSGIHERKKTVWNKKRISSVLLHRFGKLLLSGSNLSDRHFSVELGNFISSSMKPFCGVPQGLILGPTLLTIYYTKTTQLYLLHRASAKNTFLSPLTLYLLDDILLFIILYIYLVLLYTVR